VFLFLSGFQIPVVFLNIACKGSVMESILHFVDLQLRLSGGLNEYLGCPVSLYAHLFAVINQCCSIVLFFLGLYIDRNSCCKAHGG